MGGLNTAGKARVKVVFIIIHPKTQKMIAIIVAASMVAAIAAGAVVAIIMAVNPTAFR